MKVPYLFSQPESACHLLTNPTEISPYLLRELAIILFLPSPIQCNLHLLTIWREGQMQYKKRCVFSKCRWWKIYRNYSTFFVTHQFCVQPNMMVKSEVQQKLTFFNVMSDYLRWNTSRITYTNSFKRIMMILWWCFCFNYIYSRFWSKMLIRYEEYYCLICCHITFPLLGAVKNMLIYLLYGLLVVHNFHWHKPHFAWSISSCQKNFNHYS